MFGWSLVEEFHWHNLARLLFDIKLLKDFMNFFSYLKASFSSYCHKNTAQQTHSSAVVVVVVVMDSIFFILKFNFSSNLIITVWCILRSKLCGSFELCNVEMNRLVNWKSSGDGKKLQDLIDSCNGHKPLRDVPNFRE
jgi:hypothetical protein